MSSNLTPSAICEIPIRGGRARRLKVVGPFSWSRGGVDSRAIDSVPLKTPRQSGRRRLICRAPRGGGCSCPWPVNVVGNRAPPVVNIHRPPAVPSPGERPKGVVHTNARFGIVNPPYPFPHRHYFFLPNPARATPGWSPYPGLSPAGQGEKQEETSNE